MLTDKNARYQSIGSDYELTETAYQAPLTQQRPPDSMSVRDGERTRWLPWLLVVFILCLAYFISMLYSVQLMGVYADNFVRFELIQWGIFIVPSLIVMFLVMTPFPRSLRHSRHALSKKKPPPGYLPTINILNAIFCLLAVAIYLNIGAFPDYRKSRWDSDLKYQERLPIPNFAWIFMDDRGNTNDVFAVNETISKQTYGTGWTEPCEVWNVSNDANPSSFCSDALEWIRVGPYNAYHFDSRKLPQAQERTINDLQTSIWLRQYLSYNSTLGSRFSDLYQGGILYDPNITNLTQAWECGLLSSPRLVAIGTNYVNMHLTQMQDEADMFDVRSSNDDCERARKSLFPRSDSIYNSWTWSTSSRQSSINMTTCDVANKAEAACISTTVLSYDSQMIQNVRSQPGISRLNVWLNAGSIIGGVQFFFWFMTMFAAY